MGLAWRYQTSSKDMLWSNILRSKYSYSPKIKHSSIWKSILLGIDLCKKGTAYLIGNGTSVSLWHDKWAGSKPLYAQIEGPLLLVENTQPVSHIISNNSWDLENLSMSLPFCITNFITSINLPISPQDDCRLWDLSPNRIFSTKSAYSFLASRSIENEPLSPHHVRDFRWLWKKLPTLPKIKTF